MSYTVVFAPTVLKKDIPALNREILERTQEAIEAKLKVRPNVLGKPLRHALRNHKALRVGDFRIVYRIDGKIVRIIAIVHRRDVYPVVGERIRY